MKLLLAVLASMLILPQTKFTLASIPFVLASGAAAIVSINSRRQAFESKAWRAALLFLLVCSLHVLFVIFGVVAPDEYVRGLVPFTFLFFIFITLKLTNWINFPKLYYGIVAIAAGFALQNLIYLPKVLTGEVWRTTLVNENHNIPMPVVGFHFAVAMAVGTKRRVRQLGWLGVACMMLGSTLLTGTRSMLIASIVPLTILVLREARKKWLRLALLFAAFVAIMLAIVPLDVMERGARIGGSQAGSIDTRMQENSVALKMIAQSPFIGNGLGFLFDTTGLYYQVERVGYVHNSFLYLLMDFGLPGMLYIWSVAAAMRRLKNLEGSRYRLFATSIQMALLGLMIESLGFAMVRLIQFNVLLSVLVGAVEALKRDASLMRTYRTPLAMHRPVTVRARAVRKAK